jgi:hypothetical protein
MVVRFTTTSNVSIRNAMAKKLPKLITLVLTPAQVANLFKKAMEVVAEVCRVDESRFIDIGCEELSPVQIRLEIIPEDKDE